MRLINAPDSLGDMLQWCHRRYGGNGYRFQWKDVMTFGFPDAGHAMEFRLTWS